MSARSSATWPSFLLALTLAGAAVVSALQASAAPPPKRLLVVSVTKGFRHDSIPTAERLLQSLADESKAFTLDYARTDEELVAKMTVKALAGYDGVVFASTTGELPLPDRQGFVDWVAAGHAFVGIHSATDTYHEWPPFIQMIGGEFKTHGPQVKVALLVQDAKHPATRGMASPLEVFDEIYQYKSFERERVHTLLALDKHPNEGTPGFYPLAWTRAHGKGRVFYTGLGHREDVLEASWFRKHLLGGTLWALGLAS
jgi:type 1 glutamine amidotransferase